MARPKKTSKAGIIFIDSDAFIALIIKDDTNHIKAKKQFSALADKNVIFCSSNYVYCEVITVLSQRVSHRVALQFIETIRSTKSHITTKWVTPEIEELAVNIFAVQNSKNVSFTDCTNMAFMSFFKVDSIFSFDRGYKTNGFQLLDEFLKN